MQSTVRTYSGVRAVIFDISGTVLDYGSRGPVAAFVELFARHGVALSPREARGPMGAHKRDHIRSLLNQPEIARRWEQGNGSAPSDDDLERLYTEFAPLQTAVLVKHCDVIPGVPGIVAALRERGIRIANTTGFDSSMMQGLIEQAREGGYTSDLWVCPDIVGEGRPAPWMAFYAARKFGIYPMSTFVKVGDTPLDIAEAHAAGMWAVAVTRSGNEVGLSRQELEAMPDGEVRECLAAAHARLSAGGPHYIIETVAELLPVIDEITARLQRGERP